MVFCTLPIYHAKERGRESLGILIYLQVVMCVCLWGKAGYYIDLVKTSCHSLKPHWTKEYTALVVALQKCYLWCNMFLILGHMRGGDLVEWYVLVHVIISMYKFKENPLTIKEKGGKGENKRVCETAQFISSFVSVLFPVFQRSFVHPVSTLNPFTANSLCWN